MAYDIEIKGLDEMRQAFEEAPESIGGILSEATKEAGKEIFRTAVKEAPHYTGNLQRSMHMEYSPIEVSVMPKADYAPAIEFGTEPHAVPASEIAPWAFKKGLNPWAVANSIKKKGTKANPFMGRTREGVQGFIESVFDKALEAITNILAK